ncbi:hypothetical protein FGIG_10702 [Fasciola gigantica]|uniref:Uncharacterized protein n=1 Tax=Fasciola gigantica TaxID=46835 RepID=A0A504YMH2_FASGI|nr:hypothetical protein FGIG_10702 [Fasciola gigantica]
MTGTTHKIFSGISMFTVVILLDDENQDVCIMSQKWLSVDETHASIPNLDSAKLHRLVINHATLPDDTPLRLMSILIHTGRLSISKHPKERPSMTKHREYNVRARTISFHPVGERLLWVYLLK